MKEYVVKGMTCAACVRAVEKAASKAEGVSGPVVSLATEKLTFELSGGFDEEKLDFVKELKNRVPANLEKKMAEVNAQKKLTRRVPTLVMVTDWIEQAKKLPAGVEY